MRPCSPPNRTLVAVTRNVVRLENCVCSTGGQRGEAANVASKPMRLIRTDNEVKPTLGCPEIGLAVVMVVWNAGMMWRR
jgi:hypothetical protein